MKIELSCPMHLENVEVEAFSVTKEAYHVAARVIADEDTCPECGGKHVRRHGSRKKTLLDVPHNGRLVYISLTSPRWRCQRDSCLNVFFPRVIGAERTTRMTDALLDWMRVQLIDENRTYLSVALELSLTQGAVRRAARDLLGIDPGKRRQMAS